MRNKTRKKFWEKFRLHEMSKDEWEALCDRCGKCCLIKLEDEDTLKISYTSISCRLFDDQKCECNNYILRQSLVTSCIVLDPKNISESHEWMPSTCAYRLLYEGKKLKSWHYLISKDSNTINSKGMSMKNKTLPEYEIPKEDWENFIDDKLN